MASRAAPSRISRSRCALPRRNCAATFAKQRVAVGRNHITPSCKRCGTSLRKLALQVLPLELELTRADGEGLDGPDWADLGFVERITPRDSFAVDCREILIDGKARVRMRLEAFQLWVMLIAARLPTKNCSGEQCFSPQGDETLRIEIPGMQRPQTH